MATELRIDQMEFTVSYQSLAVLALHTAIAKSLLSSRNDGSFTDYSKLFRCGFAHFKVCADPLDLRGLVSESCA